MNCITIPDRLAAWWLRRRAQTLAMTGPVLEFERYPDADLAVLRELIGKKIIVEYDEWREKCLIVGIHWGRGEPPVVELVSDPGPLRVQIKSGGA